MSLVMGATAVYKYSTQDTSLVTRLLVTVLNHIQCEELLLTLCAIRIIIPWSSIHWTGLPHGAIIGRIAQHCSDCQLWRLWNQSILV
jgi:hypothetical protein